MNPIIAVITKSSHINEKGMTIKNRVKPPYGYKRVSYEAGTFESFIQNYTLKEYGSSIINYDKTKYFYQIGHIGILTLSVPENGLQQCADALIRLRAEYLWKTNQKEKIGFEFTSGHYCSWKKYAAGYRPKIEGNKVTFYKIAKANYTKTAFYKYLNLIYMYSGTLSLYNELPKVVREEDLQLGDMLVKPGTPGHILMLVDEVINKKGEKLFVLAQGNIPAQSVHLLKNFNNASLTPWYSLKKNALIQVPGYSFDNSQFIRFKN
ncbi:DUF4846 domain-containing protein [Tenacibaculum maritimum]|uniref:DUF4846 domain-containing protein n=1 Tax=Tenacibaculum maritimum TaxID=107401 RepID=UPI001E3FC9F8|nr:DUF4846 domain-containing protein [Tenacibaculum maritimum]MCD9584888.1 DUF4846 domain-containing protein [Tenacibaculum maritimum]MCD9620622.1 DUF4846 domain-containing protein [Tenacibaculum maritimum]MCD9626001.1 DUF4846 domain-containing protein [Tenacibaculum maritimum]MCD9629601.1 DUF4846 domain-containing protein [Tenacibaculum maritimum]MCD9632701.1 DUF4846 domain-containing protein [Tenacibaculum maritimum]